MYKSKINLIPLLLFLLFSNIIMGIFIFTSRAFPRLAIWNIKESQKVEDFSWPPESAPDYFYFEPNIQKLNNFKSEISVLIKNENNQLMQCLIVADYVMNLGGNQKSRGILSWGSPLEISKQIKAGKKGDCFHYSILFSSYLASIGMKSRLWALEGDDGLGRYGHTVAEIYLKDLNRWVMIDVVNRIFFTEHDLPLSVLELRERLLTNKMANVTIKNYTNLPKGNNPQRLFYKRLLKMVFLRTANDYVHKYESKIRYGKLNKFEKLLDKLPSQIKRGLNYLFGRRDYLIHYVDKFDGSLKRNIALAKTFFYFFIISLFSFAVLSLFGFINLLKNLNIHQRV